MNQFVWSDGSLFVEPKDYKLFVSSVNTSNCPYAYLYVENFKRKKNYLYCYSFTIGIYLTGTLCEYDSQWEE